MHVLLVRHGQSANNILEATHGCGDMFNSKRSVDPRLSPLGERQAQLLGKHLGSQLRSSRDRIHLFCSSMTRALQTVMPLARELELPPIVHPQIYEVKGFYDSATGAADARGPGRAALTALCPECITTGIPEDGQGGETAAAAWDRVRSLAAELQDWANGPWRGNTVILVSHNDTIALLARLLLVPSGSVVCADTSEGLFTESYMPMNNTGISHFIVGIRPKPEGYLAPNWMLYWSRSDHLPEALRSGVNFVNCGTGDAAVWARVGEGGSGVQPAYSEPEVLYFGERRKGNGSLETDSAGSFLLAACLATLAAGFSVAGVWHRFRRPL